MRFGLGGSGGSGDKLLGFKFIFKIKLVRFVGGLDVGFGRKRC